MLAFGGVGEGEMWSAVSGLSACVHACTLVVILLTLVVSVLDCVSWVLCSGLREELEGLVQVLSRLTADSEEREASDIVLTLVVSLPV